MKCFVAKLKSSNKAFIKLIYNYRSDFIKANAAKLKSRTLAFHEL